MKKIKATLILVLIFNLINAQNHFRNFYTFSNPTNTNVYINSISIIQTADSGYAFIFPSKDTSGITNSFTLAKADIYGNIVWSFSYDLSGYDDGVSLTELSDHSFAVAGSNSNVSQLHYWHISSTGLLLIAKILQPDINSYFNQYAGVVETSDSNLLFVSSYVSQPAGFNQQYNWFLKTDFNGNPIWSKMNAFDDYHECYVSKVINTSDGGFFTGVRTTSTNSSNSDFIQLLKTDSAGNVQWYKQLGNGSPDVYINSLVETSTGDFLACGNDQSTLKGNFLIKLDGAGNVKWIKQYGYSFNYNLKVRELNNGNYLLLSQWIEWMVDTSGTILSSAIAYDSLNFVASVYSAFPTSDDGLIIIGRGANNKLFIVKTDNVMLSGCYEQSFTYPQAALSYTDSSGFIQYTAGWVVTDITASVYVLPSFSVMNDACLSSSSVFTASLESGVEINPNPFSSKILVTVRKQRIKHTTLTIKNILGQSVFNQQENNLSNKFSKTIDLSFLSSGIYLLDAIIEGNE